MSLVLGKELNRVYTLRHPFLDGYFNIGAFCHKKNSQVLFKIDPSFPSYDNNMKSRGIIITMFKNLRTSKFCEVFIDLHSYRSSNLDIYNQIKQIQEGLSEQITYMFNETIQFGRVEYGDKFLNDCLILYGLTMTHHQSDYLFVIAERHNILKQQGKKVVRTTAVQISSQAALETLEDFRGLN